MTTNEPAAIDPDYFWRPMIDCPRNAKVQLLGEGGVAIYSTYNGNDDGWQGWAPLPKRREESAK